MTKSQYASLDAVLFGLQLMTFEILWIAFPWMESIWIREEGDRLQLFVQTAESQDEKEWDDLNYLLREIFDVEEKGLDEEEPGSKRKIEYSIAHGPSVPKDRAYRELMSDRVFEKLAKKYKKYSPGRLEIGR